MSDSNISVLVFEDNKSIREGLQFILDASPGFACVGAFANAANLISRIEGAHPDVVLMDIQMPGITGIEAVSELRKRFPELPVLMQTVFEDETRVFAAICAGANGYILKNTTPVKLLEALREAVSGGSPMTPSIAAKVLKMVKSQNPKTEKLNFELSDREKEILSLLVDGLSYKMIAGKLEISYETVHSHIKKIYTKLHVSSINEAVGKALRNKLVD